MGQDFRDPNWLATERQLVERARRGDRAAFGELYSVFAPTIYRQVLLPKLADPASAEDVLAETFISAFSRLSRFSDRGLSIYFWLARIASNKATDLYRSRGRAGRGLANLERLLEPLGQVSEQTDEDLLRRVDAAGLRQRVAEVLQRVNPRYRRAIEARFLEGLSRKVCAEKLQVKLGTFDVLLLRALRAFRKEWTDG